MAGDPLVDFLRRRSRRRFAALVKATREDVLDAAYRVTGDRGLAEDVTQDVFVKLLTARWKPERIRSGKGLLMSTAVLAALMRVRAEGRRAHHEREAAARPDSARSGLTADQVLDIRDAILDLPSALQACVELRYYGGLSTREIAITLECSQGAVKARLARARSMLRDRLGPPASVLLSVLAGEGKAASAVSPSLALRRALARLVSDGPAMTAMAAGAATGAAGARAAALAPVLLVLAAAGGWLLAPESSPAEGHQPSERRVALSPSERSAAPPAAPRVPPVAERTLRIELGGDGPDWPPETVRVRLTGEGVDRSCLSERGAPVSMLVPPGSYTLEADGRPRWSRESLDLSVEAAGDPEPVSVTLADSFDLEGFALDPAGRGVEACQIAVLGADLEEICTVTTSDRANAHRRPALEPYGFRVRLPLGSSYELRVLHSLRRYEPSVVRIRNEDGARTLRRDLVLEPAGPPLRLQLRGCDGAPPEASRLAHAGVATKGWHHGFNVLPEDRREDGMLLLRTFPREAPFALLVQCPGHAPRQLIVDPSELPELLEVHLDCARVFHGRVEPARPRNAVWSVQVEGPTLRSTSQAVDEDGCFRVSAPDLEDVNITVHGLGYEPLLVDPSVSTSPGEPAILRPESFGDGDACVRVALESGHAGLPGATVSLEPSKQDYSNLYRSYSVPLSLPETVFEGVLPGYYHVVVKGADGEELARVERQLARAPETALRVTVERTLCAVQIRNRRAPGDLDGLDLFLEVDGELEVEVPPAGDATLELPIRPGWHEVELSDRRGGLLFRGFLDLRAEPPAIFDLSRVLSIDVRRNGSSAPLALRGTSGNLSDGFKQSSISFPLDLAAQVTRLLWVLGPQTMISFEGEHGYFLVNPDEGHVLELSIGRRGALTIPLERRNDEGRCFLMGTLPGERAIYWALAPARSGDSVVAPVETELSRWALLQYRSRRLEHVIAGGVPLEKVAHRIRVIAAGGAPLQGASVAIVGKRLLGVDLGSYFHHRSREFFFTLGEGTTDEDGYVSLLVPALEEAEVVASHGGRKRALGLPRGSGTSHGRDPYIIELASQ